MSGSTPGTRLRPGPPNRPASPHPKHPHNHNKRNEMMDFRSVLKGGVAETAVRLWLQACGYTVLATSVEQMLAPVATINQGRYAQMSLPLQLRYMPDLLVVPPAGTCSLVEVKYRWRMDLGSIRWLREKAAKQQSLIPDVSLLLIRAICPAGANAGLDDVMRILPPGRLDLLAAGELALQQPLPEVTEATKVEGFWRALTPLSAVFPNATNRTEDVQHLVRLFLALSHM